MKNINTKSVANVDYTDVTQSYSREIERYPLLTAEEERELTERIQHGDRQALERLICSNLRLVAWIARQYYPRSLSRMDLIQEGNLALTIAASGYRGVNGTRFATYARTFVERAIRLALSLKDTLIKRQEKSFRYDTIVRHYVREVEQRECRQPSAEEVAEATGISLANVVTVLYNTCIAKDVENYDRMDDDEYVDPIDAEEDIRLVAELLSVLDDDERLVTEHLYGLNGRKLLAPKQIAEELDIAYSRVRKLSSSAMKKMVEMAERKENEKKKPSPTPLSLKKR